MSEPVVTTFRVPPDRLEAFRARQRQLGRALVVAGVLAAMAPIVTVWLGLLVPVGLVACFFGVRMVRAAPAPSAGEARVARFVAGRVTAGPEGGPPDVEDQPIVSVRAFDDHLALVVGTMAPTISLRDVAIACEDEARETLVERLRKEHGVSVQEGGSQARFYATAFTVVPAIAMAFVVATRVVTLAVTVGVLAGLQSLDPTLAIGVVLALALGAVAVVAARVLRRG